MKIKLFATAAILALGLAACGGGEPAPAEPTPVAEAAPAPAPEVTPAAAPDIGATPADIPAFMKTRHDNYEDIGKNMKALQDNMKAATPDMAAVTAAATKIKDYAGQMGTWFPAGTGPDSGIKTEAKANIWTDRATFDAAVVKLQEESTKLAAVTDAAGFKAQFPVMGGACKNCHDTFREEEKK
jgi:cytochrome c556